MNRILALTMSLMLVLVGIFGSRFEARIVAAGSTIEAGDWIKYDVTTSPTLEGEEVPTWMKFEFTNIEGTNATLKATIHLSSGQEEEYSGTIDITSGSDTSLIIRSNSTIGDSVYISGYGKITIEGEATLIYTGVNRTVVKASFSNSTEYYAGFWDRQTGIRLEDKVVKYDTSTGTPITTTTIFKISNTNIWQTRLDEYNPFQNIFYLVLILGVIAIPVTFLWTRKKKTRARSLERKGRDRVFPSHHERSFGWLGQSFIPPTKV
jgi:hypothetical protein